jgi:hypothetical protein
MNSPYIVAGGSASLILPEKTNYYGKPLKGITNKTYLDYGIILGAGFELDFKRVSITLEGRYYKGLKELTFNGLNFKRSGLYFTLGVLFW